MRVESPTFRYGEYQKNRYKANRHTLCADSFFIMNIWTITSNEINQEA